MGHRQGERRAESRPTVMLLGDSLCTPAYNDWFDGANAMLGTPLDLIGVSAQGGGLVVDMGKRAESDIVGARARPTFCMVEGGGNDIRRGGIAPETIEASLAMIYARLRSVGITAIASTVLAGTTEPGEAARGKYQHVNGWLRSYCREHQVVLCDWVPHLQVAGDPERLDAALFEDTYHPNPRGRAAMADALAEVLSDTCRPAPG